MIIIFNSFSPPLAAVQLARTLIFEFVDAVTHGVSFPRLT
jgi:hypothetical protein